MADRPSKKSANSVTRNDKRQNGKASKKAGASKVRKTHLTYLEKTLLGGGAMVEAKRLDRLVRTLHPDRPRRDKVDA